MADYNRCGLVCSWAGLCASGVRLATGVVLPKVWLYICRVIYPTLIGIAIFRGDTDGHWQLYVERVEIGENKNPTSVE